MTQDQQTPGERSRLDAFYQLAVGQHRAGRLVEAAATFREMLSINPQIAAVQNYLGVVHCQLGQFDEALPRFEQAAALDPQLADAQNNLGNILQAGRVGSMKPRRVIARQS